jgi:RNA polymerase-binding transcription factor DksA
MNADTNLARLDRAEQRLLAERTVLVAEVADARSESVDVVGSETIGWSDTASATYERELDTGLIDELDDELNEVVEARRRVDDGSYGRCEQCGESIGDERLDALPSTRWCIVHAREQSRRADSMI